MTKTIAAWEPVAESTARIRVPGGWLYRCWPTAAAPSLAFVPDPPAQLGLASQIDPAQWHHVPRPTSLTPLRRHETREAATLAEEFALQGEVDPRTTVGTRGAPFSVPLPSPPPGWAGQWPPAGSIVQVRDGVPRVLDPMTGRPFGPAD